jgi:hypothetical protein
MTNLEMLAHTEHYYADLVRMPIGTTLQARNGDVYTKASPDCWRGLEVDFAPVSTTPRRANHD